MLGSRGGNETPIKRGRKPFERATVPSRLRRGLSATDYKVIRAELRGLECLERGAPEHEVLRVDFAYRVDIGAERGVLERFEAQARQHFLQRRTGK